MFARTLKPDLLIGDRSYALGSVVEVGEARLRALVRAGVAEAHPGPACEPAPAPETATSKPKTEKRGS